MQTSSFLYFTAIFFFFTTITLVVGGDAKKMVCNPRERQALLTFKQSLVDPSNRLSSWTGEHCCSWLGIQCHAYNATPHIVAIDLRNPYDPFEEDLLVRSQPDYEGYQISKLSGKINPSLLELKHLHYLDLSLNDFGGTIPPQLGNLTNLYYLNLSSHFGDPHLTVENLQWVSTLSHLQYLDLSNVNLSLASDHWLQVINMLPSLLELRLSYCELFPILSFSNVNFTSLKVLDLSWNFFNPTIPKWLFNITSLKYLDLSFNFFNFTIPEGLLNLTSLKYLDLSRNRFHPTIPEWLFNLTSLKYLDLSYNDGLQGTISAAIGNLTSLEELRLEYNSLTGTIPAAIGNLISLEHFSLGGNSLTGSIPMSIGRLSLLRKLDLNDNKLNGTIPETLWQISNLEFLDFAYNSLEGVLAEAHFANLTKLKTFMASSNPVVLKVSSNWNPPFQVEFLDLSGWILGPKFPAWLQTQEKLSRLYLSSSRISGNIPTWFWNMTSSIPYFNLSHNQLKGKLPSNLSLKDYSSSFHAIDLNSNQFEGPLPRISSNVQLLDLSNNSISGPISSLLCKSSNKTNSLLVLILSHNLLSGEIPNCWMYWKSLKVLKLDNNNLVGSIPSSIGSLVQLTSLHLESNSLYGELPLSMQTCKWLRTLDLGDNKFSGNIPAWVGTNLPRLKVLRLRSNEFDGNIPSVLCYLTSLQVLDMSRNNLLGKVPSCFSNFSAMTFSPNSSDVMGDYIIEVSLLVIKGIEVEDSNNLRLETIMDLSTNNLSGGIPEELTSLLGLRSLNLSNNHLTGKVPEEIGDMSRLESLDFSNNQLSGVIPPSMSNLNYLGYLNLSCNNLYGEIPSGTQLQRFNPSSYADNNGLCGPPLEEKCKRNEAPQSPNAEEGTRDNFGNGIDSFYVSMAVGFVLGSWSLWGVLIFNKSWRFSYWRFIDCIINKICIMCNFNI